MKKYIISPILMLTAVFIITACEQNDTAENSPAYDTVKAEVVADVLKSTVSEIDWGQINKRSITEGEINILNRENLKITLNIGSSLKLSLSIEFIGLELPETRAEINGTLIIGLSFTGDGKICLTLNTDENDPLVISSDAKTDYNFTLGFSDLTVYYNLNKLAFRDEFGVTGTILVDGIPLDIDTIEAIASML